MLCYITCVMLCYVILYNMCYVKYICYMTYVKQHMLYNICYVIQGMLYYIR